MTKGIAMVAVCATLTCAGTALATTTPQQKCDYRRIIAWKKYQSCVYIAIARAANGTALSDFAPHAYCRHAYFLKWTAFQSPKQSQYLAGSTCVGDRFADNGNQTVTDNLTGLVWEKKDNLDSAPNSSDPHDADNAYTWNNAVSNFRRD